MKLFTIKATLMVAFLLCVGVFSWMGWKKSKASIDFKKMELVTRTMYQIGLTVANRKERLVIDNPYSTWGKN